MATVGLGLFGGRRGGGAIVQECSLGVILVNEAASEHR